MAIDSEFSIQVDDGSEHIPHYAADYNKKVVDLHDWQRKAIDYFFNNNCKTIFEVTTGAGKTFMAIEILKKIHERDPNAYCLIIVPSNVILETVWHKELYSAGYSLKDIGIYYGHIKEFAKITITNMQSLSRVPLELFDVLIADEVHHYGTKRLLPFMEYPFKYKIGLSATVERMDTAHWEILKHFNYNMFKYTPHEAIQEGILNPFDFHNVSVEMDFDTYEEYLELTQNLNLILKAGGGFNKIMKGNNPLKFKMLSIMNKRKQLVNNYKRKFEVAMEICKKHRGEKIIIFNQFNDQTNKLYWYLLEVGINCRVLHSGIKKEERQQAISDFKLGKINVLAATKVLDEGWNVPAVQVAIIMAGDSTAKQTIQRLGRILRKQKDKGNSILYQVYCRGTMEEEHSNERAKLFKQLSSHFNDYNYRLDSELNLEDKRK